MPVFSNSDQFYGVIKELFKRVEVDQPDATKTIAKTRMYFRLSTYSPDVEINLNGRMKPVEITYGPAIVRPDIMLSMPADMLHQILLAELPLKKAVATGKLKVKGNIMKALGLDALFHSCQSIYPQVLLDLGINGKIG
jgi:putative sterol carrier protein